VHLVGPHHANAEIQYLLWIVFYEVHLLAAVLIISMCTVWVKQIILICYVTKRLWFTQRSTLSTNKP